MNQQYVIACRYEDGKLGFIFNFDPIIWGWEYHNAKVFYDYDEVSKVFEDNSEIFDLTIKSTQVKSVFILPVTI